MRKIELSDDNFCFVCGRENKQGLRIEFKLSEDNCLSGEFQAKKEFQGFANILHGGIIGLILDEVMVNLLWKLDKKAVTAWFEMKLKKPVYVGETIRFKAWIEKETNRVIETKASCLDAKGEVVALGRAKCLWV